MFREIILDMPELRIICKIIDPLPYGRFLEPYFKPLWYEVKLIFLIFLFTLGHPQQKAGISKKFPSLIVLGFILVKGKNPHVGESDHLEENLLQL